MGCMSAFLVPGLVPLMAMLYLIIIVKLKCLIVNTLINSRMKAEKMTRGVCKIDASLLAERRVPIGNATRVI